MEQNIIKETFLLHEPIVLTQFLCCKMKNTSLQQLSELAQRIALFCE